MVCLFCFCEKLYVRDLCCMDYNSSRDIAAAYKSDGGEKVNESKYQK